MLYRDIIIIILLFYFVLHSWLINSLDLLTYSRGGLALFDGIQTVKPGSLYRTSLLLCWPLVDM